MRINGKNYKTSIAAYKNLPGNAVLLDIGKIMIDRKGKIAFSAAKIIDQQFAFTRKIGINIFDVFKESADLSEFMLLFIVDPAVFVADSKFDEKAFVARKNMIFLSVVRSRADDLILFDAGRNGVFDLTVARKNLLARFRAFEFGIADGRQYIDLRIR